MLRMGLLAILGLPTAALAADIVEGSAELGLTYHYVNNGQMLIDIHDAGETIVYDGPGTVALYTSTQDASGRYRTDTLVQNLVSSGTEMTPPGVGVYVQVHGDLHDNAEQPDTWSVTVRNAVDSYGRLSSHDWTFRPAKSGYAAWEDSSKGLDVDFYTLVKGGGKTDRSVMQVAARGLDGPWISFASNDVNYLSSKRHPFGSYTWDEYANGTQQLYLNPPKADGTFAVPNLSGFYFNGAQSEFDVNGDPLTCNYAAGTFEGSVTFTTDAPGYFVINCDLDGDSSPMPVGQEDVVHAFYVDQAGEHTESFAVQTPEDQIPSITGVTDMTCILAPFSGRTTLNFNESVVTGVPGISFYAMTDADEDGTWDKNATQIFWDDRQIADDLPDALHGGDAAIDAGVVLSNTAEVATNTSAHSWGDFSEGEESIAVATTAYLGMGVPAFFVVQLIDDLQDSDGDGVSDWDEVCFYGSDPGDIDTDGNGTPDGSENNMAPESSSGEKGGLESNGRLAEDLALRSRYLRLYPTHFARAAAPGDHELDWVMPSAPPAGMTMLEVTPADLTGYTNALDLYSVDYFEGSDRVGTVAVYETEGSYYEHSKAVCDRNGGARIGSVVGKLRDGAGLLQTSTLHPETLERDTAVSFVLREVAEGDWVADVAWLREQLPEVDEGQRVLNVDVWAATPSRLNMLIDGVLEALDEGAVTWSMEGAVPEAFFERASTLGGEVDYAIRARGETNLSIIARVHNYDGSVNSIPVTDSLGDGTWSHDIGMFEDVQLDLLVDGHVEDSVWLADGIWIPTSEGNFDRASCDFDHDYADANGLGVGKLSGDLWLSGCGEVSGMGRVGIGRSLARAQDFTDFEGIAFKSDLAEQLDVCLEYDSGAFECVQVDAVEGWNYVDLYDYTKVDEVVLVGFYGTNDVQVGSLLLTETAMPLEDDPGADADGDGDGTSDGCDGCNGTGGSAASLGLLALLGLRRRR